MNAKILDEVVEQAKNLMNASSCSKEAKDAAQKWLDSIGTDTQQEQTKLLLTELEEDIVSIDGLIEFAQSEVGISHFGADAPPQLRPTRGKSRPPEPNTATAPPAPPPRKFSKKRRSCLINLPHFLRKFLLGQRMAL